MHTASPYAIDVDDPQRDLVDPALKGTLKLASYTEKKGAGDFVRSHVGRRLETDASKAKRELGIEFREIDESLKDATDDMLARVTSSDRGHQSLRGTYPCILTIVMMRKHLLVAVALLLSCSPEPAEQHEGGSDAGSDEVHDAETWDVDDSEDASNGDSAETPDSAAPEVCVEEQCDVEPPLRLDTLEPTQDELLNPERGFYEPVDLLGGGDLGYVRDGGQTLIYSYVMLDEFRDRPLTADFLADVDDALDRVRSADLKLILRFAYNLGPYPDSEPDAPLDQVLEHIEQISPMLDANADVIAVVQAGFIGAWGEWHTSTNDLTTPENREAILRALVDATPPSRAVQIRYPSAKVDVFGSEPLTVDEAFSGEARARVGHHNDCFLASDTDLGTYGRGAATMEEELAYLAEETRFVPMGGETCGVYAPRTDCATALSEMELLHFGYLNVSYHGDVLDRWRDQGCFDEIRDRLGYRLAAVDFEHSECVRPGGRLAVRLTLENSGFAAPFNERPFRLVLFRENETLVADLSEPDVRLLAPGTTTVDTVLRVPATAAPGEWNVGLWLPDDDDVLEINPAHSIRLANDGVWDPVTGYNVIGTQCIDPGAPGSVDPEAAEFIELDD